MIQQKYKLPKCWLGKPKSKAAFEHGVIQPVGEHTDETLPITKEDINPDCHCPDPFAAHLCMEGHMLECHAGMTCEDAKCSHSRWYHE